MSNSVEWWLIVQTTIKLFNRESEKENGMKNKEVSKSSTLIKPKLTNTQQSESLTKILI